MADVTIESIAIEITAAVGNADSALERLTKSLETLKSVCESGLNGADKVAKGLQKIAAAAHSFDSVNSSNIQSVATALQSFQSVGAAPDLTNFARSIQSISTAASSINGTDMTTLAANMQSFAAAMQPLQNLSGMGDISRAINALKGLPKVADGLSRMNLGTFAQQMQQITTAIQPFVTQMQNLSSSFTNMPAPIQQSVASIANYNTATVNASQSTQQLGSALKLVKFTAMYFAIRKVVNILGKFITASNEYVENLNLFTVSMGDAADEALEFANKVNSVMGIDVSQWIKNQAVFKQMTSGFGMVEEKANLVSKNMTQLGYDISSYFNISVEDSMQKLQAGLSGELEPLRRLGYALDAATLQQVAHAHGIEMNINNMSQAQKAQLRYIAIMEQSKNAMGDLSRTIESPANQIRILEARIETLKRAIGDALMPIVSAALPYITAFFQILGEAARKLAEFLGFKLPKFDYSDTMTKQNEDIASSFDEATKASKEFKGSLASIDQLNIIGQKSEKGAGTGNNFGADLDLDLPSYDFLGNLKEETNQAYNTLKDFLNKIAPVVKAIAGMLAAAFVIKKTSDFISAVKNIASAFKPLNSTGIGKIASGLVAAVGAFLLMKNTVKDFVTGKGGIWELVGAIGAVAAAAGTFIALGNPIGAVLTALGAGIGAIQGVNEEVKKTNDIIVGSELYKNGGTKITIIADAFEDWAVASKKVNDEITQKFKNVRQYDEDMQGLLDTMYEITGVDVNFSKITPADAEALKKPFDELTDYLKTTFNANIESVATSLKNAFANLNIGGGIAAEIEGSLRGLQRTLDTTLTDNQRVVDEYLDKIASGKKLSDSDLADLANRYGAATELTLLKDKDIQSYKKLLEELDFSKIDWENEDTATDALSRIHSASVNYAESIQTRVKAESQALDDLKSQLDILSNRGLLTDEQYKQQIDVITLSRQTLAESAAKQMQSIKDTILDITGTGFEQIFSKKGSVAYNATDWFASLFTDMSADEIGWYSWLDKNAVYNSLIETQNKVLQSTNLNVKTEFVYGSEESAQTAKILLQQTKPNVDITIGQIKDESGQLSYIVGTKQSLIEANVTKIKDETGNWAYLTGDKVAEIKAELKMSPFTDEYKALMSVQPKIPSAGVETAFNASWRGAFGSGMQNALQPVKSSGANPEAVSDVVRMWNSNGQPMDINVNLQSYVELDGEQLGAAVGRYQQQQMAYSNGY